MVGTTRGIKESSSFSFPINCRKPNAVTCVGIIMIIKIKVNIAFFSLKS